MIEIIELGSDRAIPCCECGDKIQRVIVTNLNSLQLCSRCLAIIHNLVYERENTIFGCAVVIDETPKKPIEIEVGTYKF